MKLAAYQRHKVLKGLLHRGRDLPYRSLKFIVVSCCIILAWCIVSSCYRARDPTVCTTNAPAEPIPEEELPSYPGPSAEHPDRFTVIINTFNRRDLLQLAIAHYAECPDIDAIRVIWCEDRIGPPPRSVAPEYYSTRKEVRYDIMRNRSLNNRFRPIEGLRTEAVVSIDDDIYVSCKELNRTFQVWQQQKRQLVGWFPRLHQTDAACRLKYFLKQSTLMWNGEYSIVLTKGTFLHRDYLEMYSSYLPRGVLEYVNEHRNCEDIAMQFLVSNVTAAPPEFVHVPTIRDLGQGLFKVKGISSLVGHSTTRSDCLNAFAAMFGRMPLIPRPLSSHPDAWSMRLSPVLDHFSFRD